MIEFARGDERSSYYFSLLPEGEMPSYRNIHLGSWEQDKKGWRYLYQDAYLTSWAMINDRWYLFGMDGYMKTGWQEYKGAWYYLNPDGSMAAGWLQWQGSWYYLDPSSGQMVRDKAVDQHYVNQAGIWVP